MSTTPDPLEANKQLIAAATAAGRVTRAKVDGPRLGIEFGRALCRHLGLDPDKVSGEFRVRTGGSDILSVDLNIFLTPDDFTAIGSIMSERPAGAGTRDPSVGRTPPVYDPITGTARLPPEASAPSKGA